MGRWIVPVVVCVVLLIFPKQYALHLASKARNVVW